MCRLQQKSVILNNNVKIIFNGVIFNSKQVIVDLDTKDARSDDEVEVIFEKSKIRADQFKTENSSDTIKFKGNVDSNFDLQ